MEKITKTLSMAVIRLLNPIVHMLLRYEVSHSEFTELARRSYVNVAYRYFSLPNRKKTASRVSVITGLSRKDVARVSAFDDDEGPQTKGPLNRATRVIGGWLSDSDFLDEHSEPLQLPLREGPFSFETLVARYSGGITARAILDELVRVGAVEKTDSDTVKLKHHGFVPQGDDAEKINVFTTHAADLLSTGIHNLINKDAKPRFQRQVTYLDMPESVVLAFEKLSHDKSQALLLELNQWLATQKKAIDPNTTEPRSRIGLGIYFFKDDIQED